MSNVLTRCQVSPGLSDSEYYVLVNGSAAYYVNRGNVIVDSVPTIGQLLEGRVRGYEIQRANNQILVQLPGEAVVGGLRTWVDSDRVSAA